MVKLSEVTNWEGHKLSSLTEIHRARFIYFGLADPVRQELRLNDGRSGGSKETSPLGEDT